MDHLVNKTIMCLSDKQSQGKLNKQKT